MDETITTEQAKPVMDKLVGQLISWMESIGGAVQDGAEATKDFVIEQAPIFVQEIINFSIACHIAWVIVCLLLLAPSLIYLGYRSFIAFKNSRSEMCDGYILGCVLSFCFAGISIIAAGVHIYWLMMAWIAPRLYLIYELSDLVKELK